MLSATELTKIVEASKQIDVLLDELLDCKLRLMDATDTKEYAVATHDVELAAASVDLEEQLSGLIEADERLIKLNAQLIECILS